MTDDIIKRLRDAIAAGPTPGQWSVVDGAFPSILELSGPSFKIAAVMWASDLTEADYRKRSADLHLIAAASPDNIAALLDRLDAAEREVERLRRQSDAQLNELERIADALGTNEGHSSVDHIERLRAENAALAADARLLNDIVMLVGRKYPGESRYETACRYVRQAENVEASPAAIDAAMAAENPDAAGR